MTGKVTTLANGIRVLSLPLPHMESVMLAAFVNVGSRNETKELNGISHYLEHMAFKGTATKDCFEIISEMEIMGSDVNAYTSSDRTCYHVSGRKQDLPRFAELIGDIMLNSTFPEEEVEKERGVILQEYNRSLDNPGHVNYHLFNSLAFPDQAVGRKTLGEPENIKSFTRQDFINYQQKFYTGENMIVGVVGNFDEAEMLALVEKNFGGLPRGTFTKVEPVTYVGGSAATEAPFTQSQVILAFPMHGGMDKRHIADVVASSVIGDGMSSPLFTEIREKRGLVYSVSAGCDIQDNIGMMLINAGTTPDKLDEFLAVTCEVLKQHTTAINPQDLTRAKNQLAVSTMRRAERPMQYMRGFVEDMFIYGEQQPLNATIDEIMAITEQDVMDSIKRMITQVPTLALAGAGVQDFDFSKVVDYLK
jgi:predicted Zn-dependent peptidase